MGRRRNKGAVVIQQNNQQEVDTGLQEAQEAQNAMIALQNEMMRLEQEHQEPQEYQDLISLILGPDVLPEVRVPEGENLKPLISAPGNFAETVNLPAISVGDITLTFVPQIAPPMEKAGPVVGYNPIFKGFDPNVKIPGIITRAVPPQFNNRVEVSADNVINNDDIDWNNPVEAQRLELARAERQRRQDEARNAEKERQRLEDEHRKYLEEKMAMSPTDFSPEERFWYYIAAFDYKNVNTVGANVHKERWEAIHDKKEFAQMYKDALNKLWKKLVDERVAIGLKISEQQLYSRCSYFIGMTQGSYQSAIGDSEYAFNILSNCDGEFHNFLSTLSGGMTQ